MTGPRAAVGQERLAPYVPRLVMAWLRDEPGRRWREVEGTLAFVDISGFTALTERLARKGKVGAEELSDLLDATFGELLAVAYADGAWLLKWGGDAVLLLFEGADHAARAARASYRMRAALRRVGRGSSRVALRMSVGLHSGRFPLFLVGDPAVHRELIVVGPDVSRTVVAESATEADQIGLTPQCAHRLPAQVVGPERGGIHLLTAEPAAPSAPPAVTVAAADIDLAAALPVEIRAHLLGDPGGSEHRRATIAFVRFSGTDAIARDRGLAALAQCLDETIRAVQHACARHGVTFFESDIDRDGGKIMLTAGAPRSGDHDEERMLRAALAVLSRPCELAVRIGVNNGRVFAGDFGPPFRKTYSVKGDAVNLAARVTGHAEPAQVVATATVVAAVASTVESEPLPPFPVKGKSDPVEAAVVHDVRVMARTDPATALIGREPELAVLRGALDRAVGGRGALVEVCGEPGIGKSHLVRSFADGLDPQAVRTIRTTCDEYERATAYWPFRDMLRVALDLGADQGSAGLLALGGSAPGLRPWLPLVAAVLDVELAETAETRALDPRFRQSRTEEVTVELLRTVLHGPVVLVVDDAHLMDEASCALLEHLCRRAADLPWLVVVTRRDQDDGFRPSSAYRHHRVDPARLDDDASAEVVRAAVAPLRPLTPHEVRTLTRRAGGNPLFLRALSLAVATGSDADRLPESMEALITSQIDRLPPPERALLRQASVLGVRFSADELRGLVGDHALPRDRGALRRLSFFLQEEGESHLRFEHQLIRDTAYEGLPYRTRRALHGRAGELLEAGADDPDEVAELLSLHYFHAGQLDKSWRYATSAGFRARDKSAPAEAEEHLDRALVAARGLRDLPVGDVVEVELALGQSRFLLGRREQALAAYRSARARLRAEPVATARILLREAEIHMRAARLPVVLRTLTRAMRLVAGDDLDAVGVRSRLEGMYAVGREMQGRYRDALDWARRAVADAERSGDQAALAEGLEALHGAMSMLGLAAERPYGEEALALYEQLGDRTGQSRALNNLAVLAWLNGRGADALTMFRRAESLAAEAGDAVGAATTRYNIGDVLLRLGRAGEAVGLLTPLVHELAALGVDDFHAAALRALGLAKVLDGELEEGTTLLRDARSRLEDLGESAEVVETDAAMVLALLARGDPAGAESRAALALERAVAIDAGHLLPWLLRLRGAALADLARWDDAYVTLSEALLQAEASSRIELGFVLAELATVAGARGDRSAAERFARRSSAAFDQAGFRGSSRYPRSTS